MFTIERERQEGGAIVALCRLDDPKRRNILSPEMLAELVPAVTALGAEPDLGAVVVTGAPPAFCAGAPLDRLADAQGEEASASEVLKSIYAGFEVFAALPVATVAAVNGPAVGAGMNLAMACDVCIAGRSARFDPRFLHLGLHPGGAHSWSLTKLVGPQAASALVLCGEVLDGPDAERRGLAWRCVEDEVLVETALGLARKAAAVPSELARRTKRTLDVVQGLPNREAATARALDQQLWSVAQDDFRERLLAARRPREARG